MELPSKIKKLDRTVGLAAAVWKMGKLCKRTKWRGGGESRETRITDAWRFLIAGCSGVVSHSTVSGMTSRHSSHSSGFFFSGTVRRLPTAYNLSGKVNLKSETQHLLNLYPASKS